MTIELPEELSARLTEAGIPAEDAGRYAVAALFEVADRAEVRAWWDALSREEQETQRQRTQESLAAGDAGRTHPASEVFARVRTGQSPSKPGA